MLIPIAPTEVRKLRLQDKSEVRQFANETLREFLEQAAVGDVFEVTGYPGDPEDARRLQKVRQAIDAERFYEDKRNAVKVFQRKGRLFLQRTAPRTPNPYPENFPRV